MEQFQVKPFSMNSINGTITAIKLFAFQVRGERSKNWQKGSENLENSGIIMDYTDPKSGLNALKFYLLYVEHLNPKLDRLFQRLV